MSKRSNPLNKNHYASISSEKASIGKAHNPTRRKAQNTFRALTEAALRREIQHPTLANSPKSDLIELKTIPECKNWAV
jgi:hypothetical protein